jgi:hypothetical protein
MKSWKHPNSKEKGQELLIAIREGYLNIPEKNIYEVTRETHEELWKWLFKRRYTEEDC